MASINIFYTKEYKTITRNVCRNSPFKDDLHSEAIILFLEKKYVIEDITDLKKFFATIVWLTWKSDKFTKKYRHNWDYVSDVGNIDGLSEEEDIKEDSIDIFLSKPISNEIDFYEHHLVLQYLKMGNSRKLSKATGIPYQTITHDIRTIKRKIKTIQLEENTNQR